MELQPNKYYHLYNRSNSHELLFRNRDNYIYFLSKYRKYVLPFVNTLAYCLDVYKRQQIGFGIKLNY